ncbi:MAG: hypothetical protein AB1898_33365 [Acidobacteriota bacterium]
MTKRTNQPVIRPQLKVQFEQINFKIDVPTLEKLRAYSEFIDSEQSYVIREALNHLFDSDSAFRVFLESRNTSSSIQRAPLETADRSNTDHRGS